MVDQRKWVESSGVKRKADKKIENEEGERINEQIKKLRRQEVGGKDLEWGEGRREKLREGGKIPLYGRAQDSETLRKVDRKLENCGRRFTERRGRGEGERENVRGGAKIILAEEPFYKKKCSEREKTTDNDKNVTESYRESKEEEGNRVGVVYERGEGDRIEKRWKKLRKVERNTDKGQEDKTSGGRGAKVNLAEELRNKSEKNLTETTLDLEAKPSKPGSVSTSFSVAENKPIRHYSEILGVKIQGA